MISKDLDILNWMATNLKIVDMAGDLVNLRVNIAQRKVHNTLRLQQDAGVPMRAIICKARREGVCLAPQTKVLTADLCWVKISQICVGDNLFAIDEFAAKGQGNSRKLCEAVVISKNSIEENAFCITLEDDTNLIATGQHRFLAIRKRIKTYLRSPAWLAVNELKIGDCLRRIVKPWSKPTFEDGWMGGLIDGEGYIGRKEAGRGTILSIAQKPGKVLDRALEYLKPYTVSKNLGKNCVHLAVCNIEEVLTIIGKTRPARFIGQKWWMNKWPPHKSPWAKIKSIKPLGKQQMIDLQTSTKTFVAEGYVSHNSTYVEGRFFYEINSKSNRYACIASMDIDASNKVFKMSKLFQNLMPAELKRPTEYSNRKEIIYSAPHRSEFLVQTAGKQVLGRGGLTHYLHPTEFAFWDKAKEQFGGAAQEVPDKPDSIIVIESTAFGVGGTFYDMFWQAVGDWKKTKDLNNYLPIFLPWFIFPDYQMMIPTHIQFEIGKSHGVIPDEWVAYEPELVAKYNLCPEQLYWRRWAIKNKCQSDLVIFLQEYPATAREAFQTTGRAVFSQSLLERLSLKTKRGVFGLFERDNNGKVSFRRIDRESECWHMLYPPLPGHEYTHGTDVMEGRPSDPQNVKSKVDYHGSAVLDRNNGTYVCIYHGRCDPVELGSQCVMCSEFYNTAWASPEVNDAGMVVLACYKEAGYPNIYQRQRYDQNLITEEAPQLGWRTDVLTRKWLIDEFKASVQDQQMARGGRLTIEFSEIIQEMRTFHIDKMGKATHLPGEHDDLLFAAMIALQLHIRCPIHPMPYEFDKTGAAEADEPIKSLARVGTFDDWEPTDEEDDTEHTV